jgi:hypothetical protein
MIFRSNNRSPLTRPPHAPQSTDMPTVTTPREWVLPRDIKSQNSTTYSHWRVYYNEKKAWLAVVSRCMRDMHGMRLDRSTWRIVRRYCGRQREMDHANLVGGCKALVDCLTKCGIIVDDAPKYFDCNYEQWRNEEGLTGTVVQLLSCH